MSTLPKEITEIIENPVENKEMHEEGLELMARQSNAVTTFAYLEETDSISVKSVPDEGSNCILEIPFPYFEEVYLKCKSVRTGCRKK